ncbi:hypothetical protein N7501_001207 [Penicillium viridicatum]|nr:hypothetical protein N7501_001207 [Penicillium viridicatum]
MIGGRLIWGWEDPSGMQDWVHSTRPRDTTECERGAATTSPHILPLLDSSFSIQAIDIQNQTRLLSFFFKVLYLSPLYIHHVSLCLQLLLRRVQLLLLLYLHSGSHAFTTAIFLPYNPYQTGAPTAVELAGARG